MKDEKDEKESKPRQNVPVRISEAGVEQLDAARGAWSRSEYIRRAVSRAIKEGMKGPEVVDW